MSSSLIPEKPLVVSPSLAATIGLEEAVMLSLLNDVALGRPQPNAPLDLDEGQLTRLLPFWNDYDIQRISRNLRDQGIISLTTAPYQGSRRLTLTPSDGVQTPVPSRPSRPPDPTTTTPRRAHPIP